MRPLQAACTRILGRPTWYVVRCRFLQGNAAAVGVVAGIVPTISLQSWLLEMRKETADGSHPAVPAGPPQMGAQP